MGSIDRQSNAVSMSSASTRSNSRYLMGLKVRGTELGFGGEGEG